MERICTKCLKVKPEEEFSFRKLKLLKRRSACKDCAAIQNDRWNLLNKSTNRKNYLFRKYGITEEDYDRILQRQSGSCPICQRPSSTFLPRRLAVDHDHQSGSIRGVLCSYCNRYRVGRYRREHIYILKNIIEYLDRDYNDGIVPKRKKKRCKKKRKTKSGGGQ